MKNKEFKLEVEKSNVNWLGRKVTGSHHGTINLKDGVLYTDEGKLTGGRFTVDLGSIKIVDVTDPDTNAQFAGHLASDDFFSTALYPEAVFEITSVSDNRIKGDLTIKGITHSVEFPAEIDVKDDVLKASGTIVVDRTKYDIKFRSGNFFKNLGDTLIYNDFELKVDITAKAA
ncbi:MAG: YceI family protein [Chitinophagaceae bacterium]